MRKGKWNEVLPYAGGFDDLCFTEGFRLGPYTARMAMLPGAIEWDDTDPFDRMIAATAIEMACPFVFKDPAFDGPDNSAG